MRAIGSWGLVAMLLCLGCGGDDDDDSSERDAGPDAAGSTTCGDDVLDDGEECEHGAGCGRRAECTARCTCEPLDPAPADTTQVLIDDALRDGEIDLGTALLYRAWAIYRDPRLPERFDGVGSELEDLTLASEIDAAWADLDADLQAALEPFAVRPSDPRSFLSIGYVTPEPNALTALECTTVAPCESWASNDGAHFRVWSCGDALSTARATVLAELEELYPTMSAYLGEPAPDDADNGAGGAKTDAYLVELNQARLRNGECQPIQDGAAGQAVPAPPYLVGGDGRVGSGYLILPASILGSPELRSTLVHEFFHVQQFSHSLQAAGSWIPESTAVWAEWHFAETDAERDRVMARFPASQGSGFLSRVRRPLDVNIFVHGFGESYEAFIWHYFAEQEVGVDAVKDVWTTIANGGARRGYNAAVDSVTPFEEHFGDFIVRNINKDVVDDAGLDIYRDQYDDFPYPTDIPAMEEKGELAAGGRVQGAVEIRKLAAQYLHLDVADSVRQITFDFSRVEGDGLVVEILGTSSPDRITGWSRLGMDGERKLTLCRDDGDDPVFEAYVALGNHDWESEEDATGPYEILGSSTCCDEGEVCWTGTVIADYDLTSEYGTLREHVEATVTWRAWDFDPSGHNLVPSGTATFSGSGEAGPCTYELRPVTYAIDWSGGLLTFLDGDPPQYQMMGNGVIGDNLLYFTMECPDADPAEIPSEAKPWMQMSSFRELPDPGDVIEGQESFDYGANFSWHFVRN